MAYNSLIYASFVVLSGLLACRSFKIDVKASRLTKKKKTPVYSRDAGVGTGVPLFVLYHIPDIGKKVTHH